MKIFRHTRLAALLLAVPLCITDDLAAQRFLVRTFTEAQGMPNATVHDVIRGDDGKLWVATRNGITTYDGVDWTVDDPGKPPRLSFRSLAVGNDGEIWAVSGQGVRLAIRNENGWSELEPADDNRGYAVDLAVLRRGEAPLVAVATTSGLYVRKGDRWRLPNDDLTSAPVFALAELEGRLVVAAQDGLTRLIGGRLLPMEIDGLPSSTVYGLGRENGHLGENENGRLWMAGGESPEGWVGSLEEGRFTLLADGLSWPARDPGSPLELSGDGYGGAMVGTRYGLLHLHPRIGVEYLGQTSGLIADGVTALHLDAEGLVWVASSRGLSQIQSLRFASFDRSQGLLEDEVTAVLEGRDGRLVLGHNRGLTLLAPDQKARHVVIETPASTAPGNPRVLDLSETDDGTLWIAASFLGLYRYGKDGELRLVPEAGRLLDSVNAVLADGKDLWIGGSPQGLLHFSDGRFEAVPELADYDLRRLVAGYGDRLYAAGPRGLAIRDAGHWWFPQVPDDAANVFAVLEDPDGTIRVGTSSGLFELRGEALVREFSPEVRQPVYILLRDAKDRLWVGTDDGVLRWEPHDARRYTLRDGFAGAETNRAAGLLDRHGQVWIGTDRGVSIYRESFDRQPEAPAPPSLRTLEADGVLRAFDGPTSLPPGTDNLVFHFRSPSLRAPDRLRFRSRLQGYENEWLEPYRAPQQMLRYTNLPPGEYRFQLQAAIEDGPWSETTVSPPIVLESPFWRRLPVALASLMGLGALLFIGTRALAHQRYARRLARQVRERTAELDIERSRLAATLDSIAEGVVATSADGTVHHLNPAAERLTGWRTDEAVGRPLEEIFKPALSREDDTAEVIVGRLGLIHGVDIDGLVATVLAADAPTVFEHPLRLRDRSGRRYEVEVAGAPIRDAERFLGVTLAFRDVTERRRLERKAMKAQKIEALGLLAGGIAHDFNNALTAILGNLQLAERAAIGEAKEQLRASREAAKRTRELTQRLLTFAKGGAPIRRATSLEQLVRETSEHVLQDTRVRARLTLDQDLWPAEIDPGQIHQVLANLLRNAAQEMEGGGEIHVLVHNRRLPDDEDPLAASDGGLPLAPGHYLTVEIADQGSGIAPEHLDKIFDPYFTTHSGRSGLGLATAYSIVEKHGGALRVHSTLGVGSTFVLDLPAAEEIAPIEAVPAEPGEGRILVMDDDDMVRMVLVRMLEDLGYTAEEASRGEEALEIYGAALDRGIPFDAVLLDLSVPTGMGGEEAIVHLRLLDPDVRAIVCSGYSDSPVMACFEDHGFRAVLPKPFEQADLAAAVQRVMDRS